MRIYICLYIYIYIYVNDTYTTVYICIYMYISYNQAMRDIYHPLFFKALALPAGGARLGFSRLGFSGGTVPRSRNFLVANGRALTSHDPSTK